MEDKELRIGNLVGIQETALHADGCNNLEAIFEIEEIKKDVAQFKNFHAGEYFNDLKPISLTGEWLVRLGFEYSNITGDFHCFHMDLMKTNNGNFITTDIRKCPEIKHVHQLQNLY